MPLQREAMTKSVGAAAGAFVPGNPDDLGLDPDRVERARELIREQVDSGRSPGIVAFVARRGHCVLHEAVGSRNPAGDPMLTGTLFSITSATKPYTAALVLSLVEDGRIGLLQCIRDYIPELPTEAASGVLVHHLLTHTTGFDAPEWNGGIRRRLLENGDEDAHFGRDRLVNAYLGCALELERVKQPGESMLYASINYELLGEIIRRVTGSSVAATLAERILDPLGIRGSAMQPDPALRSRIVERSADDPIVEMAESLFGMRPDALYASDSAGAGIVSTAHDHAVFQQMILGMGTLGGVRVLSKASVRAMTTNQIPGAPDIMFGRKEASWGYGFSVICRERWPYFGGGLSPPGSVTHAGSGGICHWIDFENEIVAAYYEIITEMSEQLEPISSAGHRFQDVITAAVIN